MHDVRIAEAVALLRTRGLGGPHDCAIVLGTGLGGLVDDIEDARSLAYAEIPHFPAIGVSGHAGRLVCGRIGTARVLAFEGRGHYYETGDAAVMKVPLGVAAALGVEILVLTNASGAVTADFAPGAPVLVSDHINLSGPNPLVGERTDRRFVPMSGAYDARLRDVMIGAAQASGIALREGVYMWFSGPSFETPAEVRMARILGADLVGMSTVPEVVLARFFGLRVVALSLVTNLAAGLDASVHTHEETKAMAARGSATLRNLLRAFLSRIHDA